MISAIFLLVGSVTGYFTDNLGIVIDPEMIRNIVMTDTREIFDLVNWGLFARIALLGVLPTIIVFLMPIRPAPILMRQVKLAGGATGAILLVAACVIPFGGSYASYVRAHKPLRFFSNPTYPIYSVIKLAIDSSKTAGDHTFRPRVETAITPPEDDAHELVIVIVGETARADHFGLNG